jgi:hypothetical protein
MPGLRIDIGRPKLPDCSLLYEKFDLLTASGIVIDWYVDRARAGDFSQVSHRELGHACMNTLLLCHESPMAHCDLVSSLLTESASLHDCLPGVLALREFAARSLMLMEHDSASTLAH